MAQAEIIYAGTSAGLAILSNPGRINRWILTGVQLNDAVISAVSCAPDDPRQVIARTPDSLQASQDGGQTWQPAQLPEPAPPAAALTLHGMPAAQLRIAAGGIERSEDQGASWQPLALDSSGAFSVLLALPYHQDQALAGTTKGEIWASTDRGRSWQLIRRDLPAVLALAAGRVIS